MPDFTPGPWESDPRGFGIKTVYGQPGMDASQLMPVAILSHGVNREANARLIASAPDLYHELSHLVRLLEPLERDGGLNVPGLDTLDGARRALAKAEGKESP